MDIIKVTLLTTLMTLMMGLIGAVMIALNNSVSSNLALSAAALCGTALIFCMQMYFELKSSTDVDHVSTNFTLEASEPSIRQWEYPGTISWRLHDELAASEWLKDNSPDAFNANRDKVFSDFAIYSFISFIMTTEFDWQLRRFDYPVGRNVGTSSIFSLISKDQECTIYRTDDIRAKLKAAGNLFANVPEIPGTRNKLCLPPETELEISERSITFKNPFCQAVWKLEDIPTLTYNLKPGAQITSVPLSSSGKPQFETRISGFVAEVTYFALRAKSPNMEKYKAWINRVLADSHAWFEGNNSPSPHRQ